MADSKTQVQQIAPDGDVILVIGTPASAKLLVSSATLKRTSQVFAAMLSSRYREGQEAGTSESPKEIPLPDDETVAMTSMCNLLHGKRLEKTLGSDRILELAIVVDKYACAEALHYQSQATLLQWLDQVSGCQAGSYCRIAAASYLLGQACAFQRATRRLVEHTSEDNTTLMKDDCGKMLPVSVFCKYRAAKSTLVILELINCSRNRMEKNRSVQQDLYRVTTARHSRLRSVRCQESPARQQLNQLR